MNRRLQFFIVSLVVSGLLVGNVYAIQPEVAPEVIAQGKILYDRSCIFCHGVQGKGDGPAAFFGSSFFAPRPNDFTVGGYKFRSTASGERPMDQDLFRTITNGVPGYMPSFVGFTEVDRWSLVAYIISLNAELQATQPQMLQIPFSIVPSSPESIHRGRVIYLQFECASCHGDNARGSNPEKVHDLMDSGDLSIRPTDLDLTNSFSFKNGALAQDIVRTLMTGLDGVPMPSYAEAFAEHEEDAWHLANYLLSLSQRP